MQSRRTSERARTCSECHAAVAAADVPPAAATTAVADGGDAPRRRRARRGGRSSGGGGGGGGRSWLEVLAGEGEEGVEEGADVKGDDVDDGGELLEGQETERRLGRACGEEERRHQRGQEADASRAEGRHDLDEGAEDGRVV